MFSETQTREKIFGIAYASTITLIRPYEINNYFRGILCGQGVEGLIVAVYLSTVSLTSQKCMPFKHSSSCCLFLI